MAVCATVFDAFGAAEQRAKRAADSAAVSATVGASQCATVIVSEQPAEWSAI